MNADNNTPESKIRQRYFLISKRWTAALLVLVLVIYGCAVLWSEFVFSVGGADLLVEKKRTKMLERLGCFPVNAAQRTTRIEGLIELDAERIKREGETAKFVVAKEKIPDIFATSPYLRGFALDRRYRYGYYLDYLENKTNCIATWIVLKEKNTQGSVIYFFDRETDNPIVKVTIESVK